MATTLSELLFGLCALIIAVAQLLIVRSTRRGMSHGPSGSASALEWSFALVPAVALAVLLAFTWRAMHEGSVQFDSRAPAVGART